MPIRSREERNAWFRDYYKKHPKLKKYHREKQKEYYWKNKEKAKENEHD
jgi:hypothetical protein